MKYFRDIVKDNNHKIVRYNDVLDGHEYVSVFEYSTLYGGSHDSHKFYNDYVVEVK